MKYKLIQSCAKLLLCGISAAVCLNPGKADALSASITEPAQDIKESGGQKYIFFGEGPQDISFNGTAEDGEGEGSLNYYWEFSGGMPSRVPEEGESTNSSTGPISFNQGGSVSFHALWVNNEEACEEDEDSLTTSHVTFEFQEQGTLDGVTVYSYIKEGEELEGEESKVQTDVTITASGNPSNITIGSLNSDDTSLTFTSGGAAISEATTNGSGKVELTLISVVGSPEEWSIKIE